MDIRSVINELALQLSNTREFLDLKRARAAVEQNPELNRTISQFQDKQASMYSQKLTQAQIERLMNEIGSEYERLSKIPDLSHYFTAVDNFNQLINSVMQELNMAIEKNF